jgi:hypothetical protein
MFGKNTLEQFLIPQISCGDKALAGILKAKFSLLYDLYNQSCSLALLTNKLSIALIEIAMHTTRTKVDYLKQIEDTKSERFYNAEGFIDQASKRKMQGEGETKSRADSHQSFQRTSDSIDESTSSTKAEHHGKTSAKGFDKSRTESKEISVTQGQSDGYNVGFGRGASCSASTSHSEAVTTTGNMQPEDRQSTASNNHKLKCGLIDTFVSDLSIPTYDDLVGCFNQILSGDVGQGVACLYRKITNVACPKLDSISFRLDDLMDISGDTTSGNKALKNRFFVPLLSTPVLIPNTNIGTNRAGYRAGYSPLEVPEIYNSANFPTAFVLEYSAQALVENIYTSTCNRAYMSPSSGKSWQLSYSWGVSFGGGVSLISNGVNANFNLRTTINLSNSYKESEICSTGQSKGFSDSSASTFYKQVGKSHSQDKSTTDGRSSNVRNQENRAKSTRTAFSKHSSCSYAKMVSCGISHTDASRKATSFSTSFGDANSRKEGHSQGQGKASSRTNAIIERKNLSQIFDNLSKMLQLKLTEQTQILVNLASGNLPVNATRITDDSCYTGCVNWDSSYSIQ